MSREPRLAFKPLQSIVCANEGILNGLFGILPVPENADGEHHGLILIALNEEREAWFRPGSDLGDDVGIGKRHVLVHLRPARRAQGFTENKTVS